MNRLGMATWSKCGLRWRAILAAVIISLAGGASGEEGLGFASGTTDGIVDIRSLIADNDFPDPELLEAQALSEIAGALAFAVAAALDAVNTCNPTTSEKWSEAAVQCVYDRGIDALPPEVISTSEVVRRCSPKVAGGVRSATFVDVVGCFVQAWNRSWKAALALRQQVEMMSACSFPDLIRLRELHVRRSEAYLAQIIPLDALLGDVSARHPDLAYYDTLNPDRAQARYTRAITQLEEARERALDFSDTLAADSPPIEVGTMIAISTAQQSFNWCHNRHPERAEKWQETFTAYVEGAPARIPTWINDVPTASNPQPIDVRGAARRTFEAMIRAHETPETTTQQDADRTPQVPDASGFTAEQCDNLKYDVKMQRATYEKELARMATLTGSVWAGCRDDFVRGAASSIVGESPSAASTLAFLEAERQAKVYGKKGWARASRASGILTTLLTAAGHGRNASRICRSLNERPLENPEMPGFDDDGKPISTLAMQGGSPAPERVTLSQMSEILRKSKERVVSRSLNLTKHCGR